MANRRQRRRLARTAKHATWVRAASRDGRQIPIADIHRATAVDLDRYRTRVRNRMHFVGSLHPPVTSPAGRPAALCRCGQMSISRRPRSHGPLKCLDSEPCMDGPFFVSRYGRVSINSAARCRKIQRHSLPSDAAVSELGVGCCNSERKGFIIDIGALQQLREEPGARSVGQLTTHRLPC